MATGVIVTICLVYAAVFFFLFGTAWHAPLRRFHVPAKAICSTLFLLTAILAATTGVRPAAYTVPLCAALALCLLGDVLLALANHFPASFRAFFLAGVVGFAAGHVVFSILFFTYTDAHWTDIILPLVSILVVFLCSRSPHLRIRAMHMSVPSCLYALCVSLTTTKGLQYAFLQGITTVHGTLCAAGCLGFFLSDFLIIWVYFAEKRRQPVRFFNLLLYYAAMLCFAFSAAY